MVTDVYVQVFVKAMLSAIGNFRFDWWGKRELLNRNNRSVRLVRGLKCAESELRRGDGGI